MELNNRKLKVLSLIAKEYLATGEPVGSKTLVSQLSEAVSSATIRNDMAELERLGLLFQPHTSAGRIPTAAGLRLYIERLMEKRKLSKQRREFIDSLFKKSSSAQGAISLASDALAQFSQCASFSVSPADENMRLKQIDFIKAGTNTLVFVLLTSTNIVKSVFVRLGGEITSNALEALSNASREKLINIPLCDITPPFIQTMAAELCEYAFLLSPFFEALMDSVNELLVPGLFINGQDNLFKAQAGGVNAIKALNMLHSSEFLDYVNGQNGLTINFPEQSGVILYSGFKLSDGLFGSIGILGPYRLDYSSIIPTIEYFSSSLENMLKQEFYK